MLRRGRRLQIFDDEHLLAGPNQAKFPAREFFDGGRIVAKTTGLVAQPGIFGALTLERCGELVELSSGAQHRQEAAITNQSIHNKNDRGEEDEQPSHATDLCRPLRPGSAASRLCGDFSLSHAEKQYNICP
jgi:hypothetical protein